MKKYLCLKLHAECCVHAKNRDIRYHTKFRDKHKCFLVVFINSWNDFTPHFHFQCVATTFDRNLDSLSWRVHLSYGMCWLRGACN